MPFHIRDVFNPSAKLYYLLHIIDVLSDEGLDKLVDHAILLKDIESIKKPASNILRLVYPQHEGREEKP